MGIHRETRNMTSPTCEGTARQLPSRAILSWRRDNTTQRLVRSKIDPDVRRHTRRGRHQTTVQRPETTLVSHNLQSHAPHGKLRG